MDGNLQLKNVKELKEILKSKNLPTSGKKEELINRLINNQDKKVKTYDTFLDLLPGDIHRELNVYRLKNEPNNKALVELLTSNSSIFHFANKVSYFTKNKTSFKKFFLQHNLNIKAEKYNRGGKFIIGELPIIDNKLLQDLIFLMMGKINTSFQVVNQILKNNQCNFRLVAYWNPKDKTYYEIMRT